MVIPEWHDIKSLNAWLTPNGIISSKQNETLLTLPEISQHVGRFSRIHFVALKKPNALIYMFVHSGLQREKY
jgi:hypothetical protein